jgi:hypothetical protein
MREDLVVQIDSAEAIRDEDPIIKKFGVTRRSFRIILPFLAIMPVGIQASLLFARLELPLLKPIRAN